MTTPSKLYDLLHRKTTSTMNSILIPTDFSECAKNAENVGMQLAKRFEAKVYLFHHASIPENWAKLSVKERESNPEALKKIYEVESAFGEIRQSNPNITIETHSLLQ